MSNVDVSCGPSCFVSSMGDVLLSLVSEGSYISAVLIGGLVLWTCAFFVRYLVKGGFGRSFRRR